MRSGSFFPSESCLNFNGKIVMDVSSKGRPALVRESGAASGGPDRPGAGCAAADDRLLFDEAHKAIVGGRLYLDPGFSRDSYIRLCLVNKNRVAGLVRRYAGTNLYGYVNGLRLEHAARLLREDPRLPVKAAALDSGFGSLRTFYRLFLARYGVTPAKYRDNL